MKVLHWLSTIAIPVAACNELLSRPSFTVPALAQIRGILSQIEAPIISALTERVNLRTDPAIYADGGKRLLEFINARENASAASGRFDYGKLEYPFTLSPIAPDSATGNDTFPPGRFHQDSFSGNANLTSFYVDTLVPDFFQAPSSFFFHLDNSTLNDDAAMNLDATLLALLSHRAHIGKIVAEAKYAANVTAYTPLILSDSSEEIRVLLTNTTQEASVLTHASNSTSTFTGAWIGSGATVPGTFAANLQNATANLYRHLIDLTTEIEVQYLLERLQ